MLNARVLTDLSLLCLMLASPVSANENIRSIGLAGTVIAEDKATLSFERMGCIETVSEDAVKSSVANKGQVLVELDDRSAVLALKTVNLHKTTYISLVDN